MSEQVDPYREPRPEGRGTSGARARQTPIAHAGKCHLSIAAARHAPRLANLTVRTLHRCRGVDAGAQVPGRLRTSRLAAATGRHSPVSSERADNGLQSAHRRVRVLRCTFEQNRHGVPAR